jgi:hypothetical protein
MTDYGSREPRHAAPPKPPGAVAFGLLILLSVMGAALVWAVILGGVLWERLRQGPGQQGAYPGLLRVLVHSGFGSAREGGDGW